MAKSQKLTASFQRLRHCQAIPLWGLEGSQQPVFNVIKIPVAAKEGLLKTFGSFRKC